MLGYFSFPFVWFLSPYFEFMEVVKFFPGYFFFIFVFLFLFLCLVLLCCVCLMVCLRIFPFTNFVFIVFFNLLISSIFFSSLLLFSFVNYCLQFAYMEYKPITTIMFFTFASYVCLSSDLSLFPAAFPLRFPSSIPLFVINCYRLGFFSYCLFCYFFNEDMLPCTIQELWMTGIIHPSTFHGRIRVRWN